MILEMILELVMPLQLLVLLLDWIELFGMPENKQYPVSLSVDHPRTEQKQRARDYFTLD